MLVRYLSAVCLFVFSPTQVAAAESIHCRATLERFCRDELCMYVPRKDTVDIENEMIYIRTPVQHVQEAAKKLVDQNTSRLRSIQWGFMAQNHVGSVIIRIDKTGEVPPIMTLSWGATELVGYCEVFP